MMVSPGLFVMIGGLIGCVVCVLAALRYRAGWEAEREDLMRNGADVAPQTKRLSFLSRADFAATVNCCPHCGAEIEEGALYCEKCGEKL